jgi:GDPmannose 4,6-dehydratase
VTRKIVAAAHRIGNGSRETLVLGNLAVSRDWGWAPEYVEAMWRMLQLDKPEDLVIATGSSHALEEFVATAFSLVGRDWREHVQVDPALFRPTDLKAGAANPVRASERLGWKASRGMAEVVAGMLEGEASAG